MKSSPVTSADALTYRGIPIANLPTISLAKIEDGDIGEIVALERAASLEGFFYLDLNEGLVGQEILSNLEVVYDTAEKYFSQADEKRAGDVRDDIKPSQDLGYKRLPGAESFEISRDEVALHSDAIPRLPQLFKDEWTTITNFSAGCDRACMTLLGSLTNDFETYHRRNEPSDTGLKIVLAPSLAKKSDVGENLHTDGGTLTLLFYKEWGLHAFIRAPGIWAFIQPIEGCAVINVGNSLQRISRFKYHSPEHRITQPVDGAKDRYYLSYFLRPENMALARWAGAS